MKKLLVGTLALGMSLSAFSAENFKTYFAPYQGAEAFDEMFTKISNAKEYAYITVYSWSMRDKLEDSIEAACKNGAKVYVVLNNDQAETRADREAGNYKKMVMKKKSIIEPLEDNCAEFKYTNKTMHEKFVIVDDEYMINSSANFSGGAITRYSESFVSFTDDKEVANEAGEGLIKALKEEFEVLFNYSKNPSYDKDGSPKLIEEVAVTNGKIVHEPKITPSLSFYSTTMNHLYNVSTRTPRDGNWVRGRRLHECKIDGKMTRTSNKRSCDDSKEATQSDIVMDMMVEKIDNAKTSLHLGVNYLIYDTVCEAVDRAIGRGLDVQIITDNKQMKSRKDCTRILSERYARKKEISNKFRYKTYSHFPSRESNYLQHSKYVIIDYDTTKENPVTAATKLIMGSHNISFKAEHSNFENMLVFETEKFAQVYKDFYGDFNYLYTLGRTDEDKIDNEVRERVLAPTSEGAYKVHFLKAQDVMAMTYAEYKKLRKDLLKKAPGMLDYNIPKETLEGCRYFDPKTGKFFGGRGCKPLSEEEEKELLETINKIKEKNAQ